MASPETTHESGPEAVTLRKGRERSQDEAARADRVEEALFGVETSRLVGRYIPIKRVGRGAFGAVYAAFDPQLDRKIALKVVRPGRQSGHHLARSLREARALAAISHPHVVGIYDVGETDSGGIYIAMEFVEGANLRAYLRGSTISHKLMLEVLLGVARGLGAAHDAGVAHRDVKPDNIMVTPAGAPKLVDFGLARADAPASDDDSHPARGGDDVTKTGVVMGTPAYMAPEQHKGSRGGPLSDQFSFCVVAYEALCGRRPFTGRSRAELQASIATHPRELPPSDHAMPRWLWPVLQRGLSASADARFASMAELIHEMQRRRHRPRRLVLGALAVAAVGVPLVTALIPEPPACRAAGLEIDGVWNEASQVEVRDALVATRPEVGRETAARVGEIATAYAEAWKAGVQENCAATHVRRTQSAEMFELRSACYGENIAAFRRTVHNWVAADSGVVDNAISGATALPPVQRCTRIHAYRGMQAPPPSEDERAEIRQVEEEIARARADVNAGRERDLSPVVERADATGYRPVQARARLVASYQAGRDIRREEQMQLLHEALVRALAGGDVRTAVDASLQQCSMRRFLGRLDEADRSCDLAGALIEVETEGDGTNALQLEVNRATVVAARGRSNDARRMLEAVRERAATQGLQAIEFAALRSLSDIAEIQGRTADEVSLLEEGLELAVNLRGRYDKVTLDFQRRLAGSLSNNGDQAASKAMYTSYFRLSAQLGTEPGRSLWVPKLNLARIEDRLGNHSTAVTLIGEVLAEMPDNADHATLRLQALSHQGSFFQAMGRADKALRNAREAGELVEKFEDRLSPLEVATVSAQIGYVYGTNDDFVEAAKHYGRAVATLKNEQHPHPVVVAIAIAGHASNLAHIPGRREEARALALRALADVDVRALRAHPEGEQGAEALRSLAQDLGLEEEAKVLDAPAPPG